MKQYFFISLFAALMACGDKVPINNTTPNPNPTPNPVTPPTIDPATVSIPVSATQIVGTFNFTKLKDVHPRLIFNAADITSLVNSAPNDPFAKPTYDDIINRANNLLGSPLLNYGLDGANLRITNIHTISNDHIPYLVLAYQFTKNTNYAKRAWDQLNAMCSWADWGANRHFLDAGIAAKAVALAYDGLYDYLSSSQRTVLYNAVRNYVLAPGKNQIDNGSGPFKWYDTDDNWNGICHGGMIMAALATYEMDSTFNSQLIATCANGMYKYIQSVDPDGASEEGMSYWAYGFNNTFLALESLKRVLGGTIGLTNPAGFKKTGWFPYLVSGPVGTVSVGDDYLYNGPNNKFLSYFWFAKFFNDANLAKKHYETCLSVNSNKTTKMNGWTDLLFYSKDLVNQGSSSQMALSGYLKGIDYMYLLEKNNDDNAWYIGMHAGNNGSSHGHLDAGSFYMQVLGENFGIGNLGRQDPYPSDYFNVTAPSYSSAPTNVATTPGRFYYYRIRTESKNCLVFNPDARPEQNPSGAASLVKNEDAASGGYYIIDLKDVYNRDVNDYKRGIKLNRTKKIVTIQDEFTPKSSSLVYWLMQSNATDGTTISSDGKTATMTRNGKTIYAVLKSPSNAVFEKVNRSTSSVLYLNETAPIFSSLMSGKNTNNQYYGKLQVRLLNVTGATTVSVDFTTDPSTVSAPVAMNSWNTSN